MSGRTERVNARDLLNRADGILFEGEAVSSWLKQLQKRAQGTLEAAKKNKVIEKEWKQDRDDLARATRAIEKAVASLDVLHKAIARREGKA